jgi:hypothetical protein
MRFLIDNISIKKMNIYCNIMSEHRFIFHGDKNEYKISLAAKDKFEINMTNISIGTIEAFTFVLNYINFYGDQDEIPAPEIPLIENMDLKDLFEDEIDIFGELLILDKNVMQKIQFIDDIIELTVLMKLDILHDKLAAIVAYFIQNSNDL